MSTIEPVKSTPTALELMKAMASSVPNLGMSSEVVSQKASGAPKTIKQSSLSLILEHTLRLCHRALLLPVDGRVRMDG